jgi:hypothetical protein
MIRRTLALVIALAVTGLGLSTFAQTAPLPLPAPSPHASVTQTVGVTDITVDYSSPGVKGRAIYGGLVPWQKLWRAGANAATKVTFSRDVTVAGTAVKAGTYSVFAIPTETLWTLILNSNPNANTDAYDQGLDVVRFDAKPTPIPLRERMAFVFADMTDDAVRLDLEWDTTRVSMQIATATQAQAKAGIDGYVAQAWRPLATAARYTAETLKDAGRAMQLIDASIAVQETWYNVWIKAGFVSQTKDKKGAYKLVQRAYVLGKDDKGFFYREAVEKALVDWPKK